MASGSLRPLLDILMLLHHHSIEDSVLDEQLKPHMPASDLRALREVLDEIRSRLSNANRF